MCGAGEEPVGAGAVANISGVDRAQGSRELVKGVVFVAHNEVTYSQSDPCGLVFVLFVRG